MDHPASPIFLDQSPTVFNQSPDMVPPGFSRTNNLDDSLGIGFTYDHAPSILLPTPHDETIVNHF